MMEYAREFITDKLMLQMLSMSWENNNCMVSSKISARKSEKNDHEKWNKTSGKNSD